MKPKAKKIITVGLALSAVGIWIPQLLMGVVQKAPRVRRDVANDGQSFEPAAMEGTPGMNEMASELGFMNGTPGEEAVGANPGGQLSLPEALSQATDRIELRDARAERVGLSDLLDAFRPKSTPSSGSEKQEPESGATGRESLAKMRAQSLRLGVSSAEILANFCEGQVLSAVIYGESGAVAMIGGHLVHQGDVLEMGIRVERIERRSVTLSFRGATQAIGIPAFEARPSRKSESNLNGDNSVPTASDSDVGNIPSAPTPIGEPTPASSPGNSETEGE